jgi:preprotein translocase SecF subunit
MNIVQRRKTWFTISIVIIIIGLLAMPINAIMGNGILNFDVEFVGGTEIQMYIGEEFNNNDVSAIIKEVTGQTAPQVQRVLGKDEVNVKLKTIDKDVRKSLQEAIKAKYANSDFSEVSDVSSTISSEMQQTALLAVFVACVAMLIYISIRFKDWKSGASAILALIHDVLIVFGIYALFRVPINNSFIAAILTIIGYSINNTIVIFDRIRENRSKYKRNDFESLINNSAMQTIGRSINTSLTTLFTITAIYVVGVASVREFAMPIIVGILGGTYSSIFISTSLWYVFNTKKKSK